MTNADVWVVVPLYNEQGVIADVVRQARAVFANVVCVDDGSRDDSAARAEAAGAVVVRHPVNLGQGAALQTGFDFALSDPAMRFVVTFDADGQHRVADVEAMLSRIRLGGVQAVFGSRFRGQIDRPGQAGLLKKIVLRSAVAYTNLTTGVRLTDAHNGLRVLERRVVERLHITQNRMAHASEIVAQVGAMSFAGQKARVAEEPVRILYTDYSRAKGQSLWNSVNILAELIWR